MPFAIAKTATDHNDLLDKIVEFVTSESCTAAVPNNHGTGYAINDVLTVSGGTSTIAVEFVVIEEGAVSATVAVAGNGYNVGDKLTVQGGTFSEAAVFNVDTLTGGAGSGVATVSVDTNGEGSYSVTPGNPAATLNDGGGDDNCTLIVTYGAIGETGVRISQSGAYTSNPSNPVSVTGGGGSSATFDLTFNGGNGWTVNRRTQESLSAVVAAGGSGHVINDDLTLVGGVDADTVSVFNIDSEGASAAVLASGGSAYPNGSQTFTLAGGTFTTACTIDCTVSGGVIQSIDAINNPGDYTVTPGNPVTISGGTGGTATMAWGAAATFSLVTAGKYGEMPANPVSTTSSGSGTGATLTVTSQDHTSTNWDLLIKGEGGGSDEIYVGIRSLTSASANNYELRGMTGYTAANSWGTQPGISPGDYESGIASERQGCYTPLDNSSITYWLFVSASRIVGVFDIGSGTAYTNMYLGFGNRFGTAADFPYPLVIAGCSSEYARLFSSGDSGYSGMLDPISDDSHDTAGPMEYRDPAGQWNQVHNSQGAGASRSSKNAFVCWPAGTPGITGLGSSDRQSSGSIISTDLIPDTGNPGSPSAVMKQTPESPNGISLLWPTMLIREGDGGSIPRDVHVELDGVYWASADIDDQAALAVSEDTFTDSVTGARYHIFQNCRRTELFTYFCIKEE